MDVLRRDVWICCDRLGMLPRFSVELERRCVRNGRLGPLPGDLKRLVSVSVFNRCGSSGFRAAENKKVRQAVSLELSFLNSDLDFLKEELSDLNSSVDIYQNDDR